ncbi:hypothetical protein ZHAS_00014020 [Anopheles sinensis]|uniref:Uncharacterized protein n=1 Tax=Anopheles sinensis TaxID=74873 RepID=A0A084W752_ANOSI|nr:hypothetical protein ZHAS_00014020 [Anopheles sinensis]
MGTHRCGSPPPVDLSMVKITRPRARPTATPGRFPSVEVTSVRFWCELCMQCGMPFGYRLAGGWKGTRRVCVCVCVCVCVSMRRCPGTSPHLRGG